MIWALLAILGVPVWLVVGALTGALISRQRFRNQPEVFAMAFRENGSGGWPRRLSYGRYLHDVLLVNSGLALVRTSVHAVERAERLVSDPTPRRLDRAIGWTLTLDDGGLIDVAVSAAHESRVPLPS